MGEHVFDPSQDWPPNGAQVQALRYLATFLDTGAQPPGWYLSDGRYARPFDSMGLLLAQRWAAASAPAGAAGTEGEERG